MSTLKRVSFQDLRNNDGKSLNFIHDDKGSDTPGMMDINGIIVYNHFSNKVSCDNDTFAHLNFYNKHGERVSCVALFNVEDECLIVIDGHKLYNETALRICYIDNGKFFAKLLKDKQFTHDQ